ncbi:gametocyte-specific factor 1-like [Apis florea]|uniref:gametocyte-specific factor 1-like n=1 Tax=Apis florea TaxID=7463 RepID=UPI000252AFD5|nr:gametocyte-specific factor 1-like [Apis florea]
MYKCLTLHDPIIICPYDKNHFIAKSRLQKHIVKCEKRYPEHYKVMCPYNATHRLFKEELEEHIITCSARNVLNEIYPETKKHGATNFEIYSDLSSTIDCTENWDIEINDNSVILTEEEYSMDNNTKTINITIDSKNEERSKDSKPIRAPRGFSEAMLREASDDSCVEDLESIVSSMGIGRGKIIQKNNKLKLIGIGRGRAINNLSLI